MVTIGTSDHPTKVLGPGEGKWIKSTLGGTIPHHIIIVPVWVGDRTHSLCVVHYILDMLSKVTKGPGLE